MRDARRRGHLGGKSEGAATVGGGVMVGHAGNGPHDEAYRANAGDPRPTKSQSTRGQSGQTAGEKRRLARDCVPPEPIGHRDALQLVERGLEVLPTYKLDHHCRGDEID